MISLQELKKVTDILGTVLSKEEVDEFMKEADKVWIDIVYKIKLEIIFVKDGDGELDIDEFVKMLLQYGWTSWPWSPVCKLLCIWWYLLSMWRIHKKSFAFRF